MRSIVITIVLIFTALISFSQNPSPTGSNLLNLGVGFSGWGIPVYVGLDHYIQRDLSLGGELSYRSFHENWNNNTYNRSVIGVSGNLNYHFNAILNLPSRWDLYAGGKIGFFLWNSPSTYNGDNDSDLGLGAQIGTRYYLSNKVGLNLELDGGNAISGGKFGVTIKI
jgi:outer membrane immunogenic protein